MKKIKIIDLLNMISKGEEVPKKIRFDNTCWNRICGEKYPYYTNDYDSDLFIYFFRKNLTFSLNDEVEIIEENKTKPLTKKDIEALGYACGEIQKCFTNGWTKSLENKPLEEHKIPEKIKASDYEEVQSQFDLDVISRINEILDYLEKIK